MADDETNASELVTTGTPVRSHNGEIGTGETYEKIVQFTFSGLSPWTIPPV